MRAIRDRLGMTQAELALELGIPGSQAEISKWEKGKSPVPQERLEALAGLVGEPVSIFFHPTYADGRGADEGVGESEADGPAPSEMDPANLLYGERLYQTMQDYGRPGEREDDKIALVALLAKAVLDARREGQRLPTANLIAGFAALVNGEV